MSECYVKLTVDDEGVTVDIHELSLKELCEAKEALANAIVDLTAQTLDDIFGGNE